MEGFELKRPDPDRFRLVPRLVAQEPAPCAAGAVFAYSNAGYGLLGCVVDRESRAGNFDMVERTRPTAGRATWPCGHRPRGEGHRARGGRPGFPGVVGAAPREEVTPDS